MGRNKGEKNIMRTPEEKEKIIDDYFNSGKGAMEFERESGVSRKSLWKWIKIYSSKGIYGLRSMTGKITENIGRPKKAKTREEKLERENAKLKIEIERLKKGYYVKGVGQRKEYVSINNKSIKSSKN
jgi:transposase-like protein